MDTATLPDEVQAVVEGLGGADVVVGLATSGPIPALAAVAAAVRTGLDAHCAGQAAAVVHVDQTPSEATTAAVTAALGDLRVVSVPAPVATATTGSTGPPRCGRCSRWPGGSRRARS
jgi:hypothetical protein